MIQQEVKPYVYRAINPITKEFYIGYRKANKVPAIEDIGVCYFTSSKYVNKENMIYEIISEFNDDREAYIFEQNMIREHWENPLLLNKCLSISKDGIDEIKYKKIGIWDQTTPEARKMRSEISKKLKLIPPNHFGKQQSIEHIEKRIESRKSGMGWDCSGSKNGRYGKGATILGENSPNAKMWKITNINNGNSVIIKSLTTFSKECGLTYTSLYNNTNKIFVVEKM